MADEVQDRKRGHPRSVNGNGSRWETKDRDVPAANFGRNPGITTATLHMLICDVGTDR